MKKPWQVSWSTIYLFVLLFMITDQLVPWPTPFTWAYPLIGYLAGLWLRKQKHMKEFNPKIDLSLMLAYTLIATFLITTLNIVAINAIPWWKIILAGVAIDVIGSFFGVFGPIGDITGAVFAVIALYVVLGPLYGGILVFSVLLIQLLPGPSFGLTTLYLIIFKLAILALGALR